MNTTDDSIMNIFYLLIGLALILFVVFIIYSIVRFVKKKNKNQYQQSFPDNSNTITPNVVVVKKSSNGLIWFVIIIFIILGITLPFHYVPGSLMVFPKNNLTFSHTIINLDDINSLVKRYNSANSDEQKAMKNEPYFRKLMEKGLIKDTTYFKFK